MIAASLIALSSAASTAEPVNCDSVKYSFSEKPPTDDYHKEAFSGVLTVCGEGPCCTEAMQKQLSYQSKRQFDAGLRSELDTLANVLLSRAIKFDVIFKEMMTKAKTDFHTMFKKTYGIIYERNSYVFTDLFDELEKYYARGQVELVETMDNFFNTLYQKMFTELNSQYKFDAKYLECVSEKMKELKPFGDVPDKLSLQLKRSFVATRTFSQALTISGNIVRNMQNIAMTSSCNRAVAKMTHCPACSGLSIKELKPCSNYCTNVMKGCLAYHSQLDSHWNDFVGEMDKVIDRLLGPFNIEMVVEPINIKISEAIMNFQENNSPVSRRVFEACGKPTLGKRRRRDAPSSTTVSSSVSGEIPFETLDFGAGGGGGKRGRKQFQQSGGSDGLEKVIREAKSRLRDTKSFWKKLPFHMCGTTKAEEQENCWNGQKKDKYVTPVVGDGMTNQQNNPEVIVDITQPSSLINEQVYALRIITSKLRTAFMGHDVEWFDDDTLDSGSGSGYGPDDEDASEGSGLSPSISAENEPPEVSVSSDKSTSSSAPPTRPQQPTNEDDNRLYPIPADPNLRSLPPGSHTNNTISDASSAPGAAPSIMFNRAALSYLVPVVIVWFSSSMSDWWQH
ncbi:Division abnormally delayed protein [Nesidiocoris tenuis]|uniref:Division abnormally delayed protein n=1 Tax=Nesidiocoris tenuis TaxID=355587 RepID=A0ABN7B2G7_9HEMI|nr:Division abnormally delayed protein [Nesidiocoris tenuis]